MSAVAGSTYCGVCHRSFEDLRENYAQIKECKHFFHENCFFNPRAGHVIEKEDGVEVQCGEAGCATRVKTLKEKISEVITFGTFEKAKKKVPGLKGIKIVGMLGVALVVIAVAMCLYPSKIAIALELIIAIPLCIKLGKVIDRHLKKAALAAKKTKEKP